MQTRWLRQSPTMGIAEMWSLIRFLAFATLALGATILSANASAMNVRIIYINGIQNTIPDVIRVKNRLIEQFPGAQIDHVYNPIGWYGDQDSSFTQDAMELILLKTAEECYADDLLRIRAPFNQSTPLDVDAANRVLGYLENLIPGPTVEAPTRCGALRLPRPFRVPNDAELVHTRNAVQRLMLKMNLDSPSIVIAHSQGNILANLAYAWFVALRGSSAANAVRIVNVANTSQISINGLDSTHRDDEALWALREVSGRLVSRETRSCSSQNCPFVTSNPTLENAAGFGDSRKHAMIDTYMSGFEVDSVEPSAIFAPGKAPFRNRLTDLVRTAWDSLVIANPPLPPPVPLPPTPPAVPQPANLVAQSLTFNPLAVSAGGTLNVSLVIRNMGEQESLASRVSLRYSTSSSRPGDIEIRSIAVEGLLPGGSTNIAVELAAPSVPGNYRVWVVVDPDRSAGQSGDALLDDEVVAVSMLTVTESVVTTPDLVVDAVDFSPISAVVGGRFEVRLTVANRGNAPSQASFVAVRLTTSSTTPGEDNAGGVSVPVLWPGSHVERTVQLQAPQTPGDYLVWLVIDPAQTAGQAEIARGNDRTFAPRILRVVSADAAPGGTAEGVYAGTIDGWTFGHFRMVVLENGEFWSLYGQSANLGFEPWGYVYGTGRSENGEFIVSSVADMGFFVPIYGTAGATYNASAGTIAGDITIQNVRREFRGGTMSPEEYVYGRPAQVAAVAGAWSLFARNGQRVALDVAGDGSFSAQWSSGCSSPGRISPRATGKNVFDVRLVFGAAPCLVPGQEITGIAFLLMLPNGRTSLHFAGSEVTRSSSGLVAWGVR